MSGAFLNAQGTIPNGNEGGGQEARNNNAKDAKSARTFVYFCFIRVLCVFRGPLFLMRIL